MNLKFLWQRYLFREMLKVFILFLGCFFFLYSLIDYSLHMQDFVMDRKIQLSHLLTYYSAQFIKRADILIPLALLISTLKVLFSLNGRGELIALQASGVSRRQLLKPLFLLGLICTVFNLVNAEYLLPSSLNTLDRFRLDHFKHSRHLTRKEPIRILTLKDQSRLIYREEDKEARVYRDVFWVRSSEDIWHMQMLSTDPSRPLAHFVDHLERNKEGAFEKKESFPSFLLPKFRLEIDSTGKGFIPLENRKISDLAQFYIKQEKLSTYERPQALTHLLFKFGIPFLSLLVIAASAPHCLKHRRHLPLFFTYALSLFLFVAFFVLMDAAVILGETLTVSPYAAILFPLFLVSTIISFYYYKAT